MAYNINDVYKIVLYFTGKNLQQGYVSPEDFNRTINMAQKGYTSYLLGSFQQYIPGRPEARVEFGQNSIIRTRLRQIIYNTDLSVNGAGFTPYPSDFLQVDAMWSYYGYNRIREIQQNQFYGVYNSTIDPIAAYPVYMIENDGFRFFPNNIGQAKMSYVINPPDMVWGYTLDGNGIPVYNPATSVQPVWNDASIMEIIVRALRIIGVNLDYNTVSAYAVQIENQGQ
jgi:hypothetical protein